MNANCCHISFYFRSDHKLSFLHYYYCSHYCHFTQKLCKQRQPYRIHFGMSQHTYYVIRLSVLLSTYSSYLPRAPDDRNITGRPWQGCHNSAASFYSCAAGFPLKSVGGREKVSLAPALSSRPDCQAGSKAPLIALAVCLFTSFKLPSSRRALCRYSRGFRTCNTVYSVFNDLKVTRNSVSF